MATRSARDFAGYRIVRPLELSDRASVWEAEDLESGRAVAIETLAGAAAKDPDVREWFAEAWEAVAEVDDPHLVEVEALGDEEGVPFAARTPAAGATLAKRLSVGGPLDPGAAVELVGQIGGALDAAHEAGVVHGTLGPASVVVVEDGGGASTYLTGFGRAEGDRREDVRDLGSILAAMLGPSHGDGPARGVADEGAGPGEEEVRAEGEEAGSGDGDGQLYEDDEQLYEDDDRLREGDDGRLLEEADGGDVAVERRIGALDQVVATSQAGGYRSAAELVAAAEAAAEASAEQDGAGARPRRSWRPALALMALAAIAAIVVIAVSGGDGSGDETTGGGDQVAQSTSGEDRGSTSAEPDRAESLAPIDVPGFPIGVSAREGVVYVVTRSGVLSGFDESDGKPAAGPVDLSIGASDVTIVDGVAWVSLPEAGGLARVDLDASNPSPRLIETGAGPAGLVGVQGSIWVADNGSGELSQVPQTGSGESKEVPLASGPNGITFGLGSLWVTGPGTVTEVDPDAPEKQTSFDVGGDASGVLTADDQVWVASSADGTVTALDPKSGETKSFEVGGAPGDIAADPDRLWVANGAGYVSTIEFGSGAVGRYDLPAEETPQEVAVGERVWVTTGRGNSLIAVPAP